MLRRQAPRALAKIIRSRAAVARALWDACATASVARKISPRPATGHPMDKRARCPEGWTSQDNAMCARLVRVWRCARPFRTGRAGRRCAAPPGYGGHCLTQLHLGSATGALVHPCGRLQRGLGAAAHLGARVACELRASSRWRPHATHAGRALGRADSPGKARARLAASVIDAQVPCAPCAAFVGLMERAQSAAARRGGIQAALRRRPAAASAAGCVDHALRVDQLETHHACIVVAHVIEQRCWATLARGRQRDRGPFV